MSLLWLTLTPQFAHLPKNCVLLSLNDIIILFKQNKWQILIFQKSSCLIYVITYVSLRTTPEKSAVSDTANHELLQKLIRWSRCVRLWLDVDSAGRSISRTRFGDHWSGWMAELEPFYCVEVLSNTHIKCASPEKNRDLDWACNCSEGR